MNETVRFSLARKSSSSNKQVCNYKPTSMKNDKDGHVKSWRNASRTFLSTAVDSFKIWSSSDGDSQRRAAFIRKIRRDLANTGYLVRKRRIQTITIN